MNAARQIKSNRGDNTANNNLDKLKRASVDVRKIMDNWNDYFYEYSEQEKSIIYTFVHYKSFELGDKFKLYKVLF